MMSGMGGMMASGMALGAGSAVGHMAVNSLMGGGGHGSGGQQQQQEGGQGQMQQQQEGGQQMQQDYGQQQENPCQGFNMNFISCLKSSSNDIGMCQEYMNMLQQCEKDNTMSRQNFN